MWTSFSIDVDVGVEDGEDPRNLRPAFPGLPDGAPVSLTFLHVGGYAVVDARGVEVAAGGARVSVGLVRGEGGGEGRRRRGCSR